MQQIRSRDTGACARRSRLIWAWIVLAACGVGGAWAQPNDPNPASKTQPPAQIPPLPQVTRTSGGRADFPSTRIGFPSRASSPWARTVPLGKSMTLGSPVITPPAAENPRVVPIGIPTDPARVFRERREFEPQNSNVSGGTRSTGALISQGSPALVAGPSSATAGGFSGALQLRSADGISAQLRGRADGFRGVVSLNSGSLTSSLLNGFGNGLGAGIGDGVGANWQNTLLYRPFGQSLWSPYFCGSERRVINPGLFSQYDPTLSPNFDPQGSALDAAQPQAAATSPRERAVAAFRSRKFAVAIATLKLELKTSPDDHTVQRDLGIAELLNGNLVEGASNVARAYLADPSLADEAFTGRELAITESDLRSLSERVVGYANRTPTVATLVTAAVLLHGRDRADAALSMIERASKVGLNSDISGLLGRAIKPAPAASITTTKPVATKSAKARPSPTKTGPSESGPDTPAASKTNPLMEK